ncbi:MAG: hypothetical protein ACT4PT_01365 [Methanobacteriota archaeon]
MRLSLIAASLALIVPVAALVAPGAAAAQPPPQCIRPCGPLVDVCVAGVTDPSCWPGKDVCVYAFSWVPVCADIPCYNPGDCVACGEELAWLCRLDPCGGPYLACNPPPPVE